MRLLVLSLVLLAGCASDPFEPDPLAAAEWGVSFGECTGYCAARLVVGLDGTATLTQTGHQGSRRLEPLVRSRSLTEAERARLADALTTSTVRTETRGCPDCADGGAEYVQRGGARVTFEHRRDAGDADPLARVLRAVYDTFPRAG